MDSSTQRTRSRAPRLSKERSEDGSSGFKNVVTVLDKNTDDALTGMSVEYHGADTKAPALQTTGMHRQVEEMSDKLEQGFKEAQERYTKQWWKVRFDDPKEEEEFREETFEEQKSYMYIVMMMFICYLTFAAIEYNAQPMSRLDSVPMPTIACWIGLNQSFPVTELIDGVEVTTTAKSHLDLAAARGQSPSYTNAWAKQLMLWALILRCTCIGLVVLAAISLKFGNRTVALGTVNVVFWLVTTLIEIAFEYESIVLDVQTSRVLSPAPNPSLPPLLFIMLVYTVGIPGIPFITACMCGWGVMVTTLIGHFLIWSKSNVAADWGGIAWTNGVDLSAGVAGADPVDKLGQQLMRVLLFNIFGTFGTYLRRMPLQSRTAIAAPSP